MRSAQVQSFSGVQFNGVTPSGGYGVHIVVPCSTPPCNVILFADTNNNQTFDVGTEEVETVSFGTQVQILSSTLGDGAHDIVFKPPRPFICLDGVCSGLPEQEIILGASGSSKTVDVNINQTSGQISS